jgi:mannose-6-phosphate isomerase-like protein (cupin superfamily)
MSRLTRSLRIGAIALVACWCTQAGADDKTAQHASAAEIEASVAKTVDGSAYQMLKTDGSTLVYVIRRDGPREVEVHRKLNDVMIVREGTAVVLIGEKVEGNREVKPNEWLGGKIIGGKSYALAPGDVLFIPAGLGHLVTPPPGGSVTYLVVKTDPKP